MVLLTSRTTGSPHHIAIQRRIGYVFFGAALVFAAMNVARLAVKPPPFVRYLSFSYPNFQNIVFNLAAGILVLVASRIDHPVMRMLQVAIFFVAGIVLNVINEPYDVSAMALTVYAILLAVQYSFFERHVVPKLVVVFAVFLGSGVAGTVGRGGVDVLAGLAGLGAAIVYLLLLWIAFSEPLKEYIRRARELELERRKESVFVRFGRNVAGLVHNLRNLLTVLLGLNAMVKQQSDSPDLRDLVEKQQLALERMAKTVERILAVVKAKQEIAVRQVDLNELLAGIADFFCTDLEFKRGVQLELKLSESRPMVAAQPLELCEVVENLVKNSWEAVAQQGPVVPSVIEISSFAGPRTGFSVRDTGPGIPGLARCVDDECRRHFAVGRSTKEKGTGLGVPFVLEAARTNGWHVTIESAAGQGTTTTVVLAGSRSGGEA